MPSLHVSQHAHGGPQLVEWANISNPYHHHHHHHHCMPQAEHYLFIGHTDIRELHGDGNDGNTAEMGQKARYSRGNGDSQCGDTVGTGIKKYGFHAVKKSKFKSALCTQWANLICACRSFNALQFQLKQPN
jgi:hypothetical protein